MMQEVVDDVEELRKIWDLEKEVREYAAGCRDLLWSELRPDDLEGSAKGFQQRLRASGCSKKVRTSGTFRGLDKAIRDVLVTALLITALRHKSMRPRHWTLLMAGVCEAPEVSLLL